MTDTTTNLGAAGQALAGGNQTEGTPQPTNGTPPPAEKFWYSDLPPELQGHLEKKGWNSPTALPKLAEGYFELEKQYRSGDKVMLPKDENDQAGKEALWNRLGRPETADKYEFPEGVDPDLSKKWAERFHKYGATKEQAKQYAADQLQDAKEFQEMERQRVVNEQNLADQFARQEWGHDYPKNMELARRAVRGIGMDKDFNAYFGSLTGSLGGKMAIKLLYMAGHAVKESDAAFIGDNNNPAFGMSKNRAQAEIKSDAGRALYQKAREGDKTALARWKTLNQQANPDGVIEM